MERKTIASRIYATAPLTAPALAIGLALSAPIADAATLTATPVVVNDFSGFTIEFADTGNGLLDFGEITSFSGVTDSGTFFGFVTHTVDLVGISVANQPRDNGVSTLGAPNWGFSVSDDGTWDDGFGNRRWTYTIELDTPAPIPLPAGLPLLLGGAGVLAALRVRKSWSRGRRS